MSECIHRDVWLIWEINPGDGSQCLRAIEEDKPTLKLHMRALRNEATMAGRTSRFFTEKSQTNHAFGHNDMKAASVIIRNSQEQT